LQTCTTGWEFQIYIYIHLNFSIKLLDQIRRTFYCIHDSSLLVYCVISVGKNICFQVRCLRTPCFQQCTSLKLICKFHIPMILSNAFDKHVGITHSGDGGSSVGIVTRLQAGHRFPAGARGFSLLHSVEPTVGPRPSY
jgi:hypothetical protein